MAVDTAAKRYSALGSRFARLPWGRRFATPLPDGEIDQGDRQQLGFTYRGILSTAPAAVDPGPLIHSPADVLRRVLITLGHGVNPPLTTWPIYAAGEPNTPDNCITVYDTEGRNDGRSMIDGEQWEHYGVQVRIRSTTHKVGYAKAQAIAEALDQEIYDEVETIDTTTYLLHSVSRTSRVLALGKDTPNSKRTLFTINALVSLKTIL